MTTITIPTHELTGAALDWAVAKIEGEAVSLWTADPKTDKRRPHACRYSHDWAQGGPIIEQHQICVLPPIVRRIGAERHAFPVEYWRAMSRRDENDAATHGRGPTPLVAAMRCYVAARLGDCVDVPQELAA